MENSTASSSQLAATSKRFARRLLTIGDNRLELLTLEMQEERERLLHAMLLAFGVATFSLLATMTLTAAVVVSLWAYLHVTALLILTGLYGVAGICLYRPLNELLQDRQALSASLDQLQKDRVCMEKLLA